MGQLLKSITTTRLRLPMGNTRPWSTKVDYRSAANFGQTRTNSVLTCPCLGQNRLESAHFGRFHSAKFRSDSTNFRRFGQICARIRRTSTNIRRACAAAAKGMCKRGRAKNPSGLDGRTGRRSRSDPRDQQSEVVHAIGRSPRCRAPCLVTTPPKTHSVVC